VPSLARGGKVSEKWVREEQFSALGFSCNRRKSHAIKKLAEALEAEALKHKLSVAREGIMEIAAKRVKYFACAM
jgi:hypothetical protein